MAMKKDFGGFELHEKIGSGGMASVYRGVQKSLDRKVVLKVLYPHLAEDEKLVARFEREARAAATMRHPNIVQVIDCGRHEDVAYIAMEFVEGMDLKKWLEKYGPPPLEVALLLMRDLFSGLEHAHMHRIVHRDIKPANIMFTPDGQLKIMDFGLARKGEDTSGMTVVGSVLGTPAYMSPEQATGEAVDERSDIFSAGVVAYELLGGQRPFQGDSYSTVLRAVLTVEPPPLGRFNPLVPDEIVQIVHKMLQKDMTRRYANTGQVRAELEALIDQMGMSRSSNLLREFAADPLAVTATLRKKRFSRHLDQGLYFENMGLGKIDDALVEFKRALHLDPENKIARDHLKKLEKERERGRSEVAAESSIAPPRALDPDSTMVMGPGAAPHSGAIPAAATPPSRPAAARSTPSAPEHRPAPARQAAPPTNTVRNLAIGVTALLVVVIAVAAFALLGKKSPAPDNPAGNPQSSQARSTPAPAPPPVSTITKATLEIKTDPPGARITVNGVLQDERSNFAKQDVAAGTYTLKAEKSGFLPASRTVTVSAGEQSLVSLALAPALMPEPGSGGMGTLVVKVAPYATYFVDDQVQGQPNTMTARVSLKAGTYTVKAVHPSFEPKVWSNVRVNAGATVRLTHDFLNVATGSLKVTSQGGWATVYLDGKPTDKTTPALFSQLNTGTYTVSLVRKGFVVVDRTHTAVVKDGETTTIEFTIRPE